MNLFDEFVSKAKDVANVAGKKTGEMVELSKLKLQAVQINSDIEEAYERLGAIVYEQEKTGTDNSDLIAVCISEVDNLQEQLAELNDRIAEAKSVTRCPNCGANNPVDSGYCSRCGSTLGGQQYGKETVFEDGDTAGAPDSSTDDVSSSSTDEASGSGTDGTPESETEQI